MPRTSEENFLTLIQKVETDLAAFYGFQLQASAAQHLLSRDELQRHTDRPGRASTVFSQAHDELFIGVHFGEDIAATLDTHNPLLGLHDANLDAFCVLVEELSHFHLIINRVGKQQELSKLELEWQGEIDKLLISAVWLRAQKADAHYLPLARKLFDLAEIGTQEPDLYWEATKHAAKFWYDIITYTDGIDDPMHSVKLKNILRQAYSSNWSAKIGKIRLSHAA